VPEYLFQLLQLQGRRHSEHPLPAKVAVHDQNMAVGIEAEQVAEGLDCYDSARKRSFSRNRILQENKIINYH
jgi:hypothetical protein